MAKVMTHDKTNGNGKMNGKATSAPFKTRNDMDADTRKKVIALLNEHLVCTFDLMSQTKQAHWNVKGPHFIGLHELFDDFAIFSPFFSLLFVLITLRSKLCHPMVVTPPCA